MQNQTNSPALSEKIETGYSKDELFEWKLQRAIEHLKDTRQSANPYNSSENLAKLLNCEIQCRDLLDYPSNGYQYIKGPAPGRANIGLNETVVLSLSLTLPITGYCQLLPIIFDKEWRLLDGLNRLYVCQKFDIPYSWIKINF